MIAEIPNSLKQLKNKYNPNLSETIDALLPQVAAFNQPPPYTGDKLTLFVSSATQNPATSWLFLRLVSQYWQAITPESGSTEPMPKLLAGLRRQTANWDHNVSPASLLNNLSDSLFVLSCEIDPDQAEPDKFQEKLSLAATILTRIVQPPAADSLHSFAELKSALIDAQLYEEY